MNSSTTLRRVEFATPTAHDLKWVCARIDRTVADNVPQVVGSGVIFKINSEFYLITAAHCIGDKSKQECYPPEQFRVSLVGVPHEGNTISGKFCDDNPKVFFDDDMDFAMIRVVFDNEEVLSGFDYENRSKFVGSDIDAAAGAFSTVAFRAQNNMGQHLEMKSINNLQYKIKENVQASGMKLADLEGISGAGVFTKMGSTIYCVGIVKGYPKEQKQFDNVLIRRIPDLGDTNIMRSTYEEFSGLPMLSFGNDIAKLRYNRAWKELYNFLVSDVNDEARYSTLLKEIKDAKPAYPNPKNVEYQSLVERLLSSGHTPIPSVPGREEPKRGTEWSENDLLAYSLALADIGWWIGLYAMPPGMTDKLRKEDVFRKSGQRGTTITGYSDIEVSKPSGTDDEGKYELIMRDAFSLDFDKMRSRIAAWNPGVGFLGKKVILESLWSDSGSDIQTEHQKELKRVLEQCNECERREQPELAPLNLEEQFIATALYNSCQSMFNWKERLKLEKFLVAGLDSPAEVLKYIAERIEKTESKVYPYGVRVTPLDDDVDYESLPAALRIIQYLINTGLPSSTVPAAMWYKVFRHLYRTFPISVTYFTLTHRDENLVKRCAQDVAYSEDKTISEFRPHLLSQLLDILYRSSTPRKLNMNIINMIMELIPAVEESVWFDKLMSQLESSDGIGRVNFSNVTHREWPNRLLEIVAGHTLRPGNVAKLLGWMSARFPDNPGLFGYLVPWLNLSDDVLADPDAEMALTSILESEKISHTFPIYAQLCLDGLLSEDNRMRMQRSICDDDLRWVENDPDAIRIISHMPVDDVTIVKIKQILLSTDIWECGIGFPDGGGISFSHTSTPDINNLSERVKWDKSEIDVILNNLAQNLSLIERVATSKMRMSFHWHFFADVLVEMKKFLTRHKAHDASSGLLERIDALLQNVNCGQSLQSWLLSDNPQTLENALNILDHSIKLSNGKTDDFKVEISILITRATLRDASSLGVITGFIAKLAVDYPDSMIREYSEQLRNMLKSLFAVNYEKYNLNALQLRKNLEAIRDVLSQVPAKGQDNDPICFK